MQVGGRCAVLRCEPCQARNRAALSRVAKGDAVSLSACILKCIMYLISTLHFLSIRANPLLLSEKLKEKRKSLCIKRFTGNGDQSCLVML